MMEVWDDDMWFALTGAAECILCRVCNFLVMSDRTLGYVPASEVLAKQEPLAEVEAYDPN